MLIDRATWLGATLTIATLIIAGLAAACANPAMDEASGSMYEDAMVGHVDSAAVSGCRFYGGRVCGTGEADCLPAPSGCAPRCFGQSDCDPGHPCVDLFDQVSPTYCHTRCESAFCPADQECKGDACQEVECGVKVQCEKKAQICDVFAQTCYPVNGGCQSVEDCPAFDQSAKEFGRISCDSGFCRIASDAPEVPEGMDKVPAVTMLTPKFGAEVPSPEAVTFQWLSEGNATILLVLAWLPDHSGELLESAIWGLMVPAGGAAKATFAEGHAIVEGQWQQASPSIPLGQPLYFVAQTVGGGRLSGVSAPVPFIIGEPWPAVNDDCPADEDGQVMGPCANPTDLLQCVGGKCLRVCLSNADCAAHGFNCGPVVKGLRLCI